MQKYYKKNVMVKITLITVVISLVAALFVPQVVLGGASSNLDLMGWSKQNNQWEQGELKGYREMEWVDFCLDFERYDGKDTDIVLIFDHKNGDITAYTEAEDFLLYEGINNTRTPNDLTVSGAIYSAGDASGVFTVSGPNYMKNSKEMTYTITIIKPNVLKAMSNFTIYFRGHISDNARQWPGTFHVGKSVGGKDIVPIKSKDFIAPNTVSGYKFNDLNGDGIWDDEEPPIEGWTIYLNQQISTTTDENGYYEFTGIAPGAYTLSEEERAGWKQTIAPAAFTLNAGEILQGKNFGNFEELPEITLTKIASIDMARVGDIVTYTYIIKNTGNVNLVEIELTDDIIGDLTDDAIAAISAKYGYTTLKPGQEIEVNKEYVVSKEDISEGKVINTAIAEGYFGETKVEGTDTATLFVLPNEIIADPRIQITKTVSPDRAKIGETVEYTYVIKNTGNVKLTNISLYDDILKNISLGEGAITLGAGKSITITTDWQIPDGSEESITNTATATGYYKEDPNPITDTATAKVEIEKEPEWRGTIRIKKIVADYLPMRNSVSVTNSSDPYSPEGFIFTLTGEDYTESVTTDEFGEAEFTNLPAGTYYITEETGEGYYYTNDIPEGGLEITIEEDDEDLVDDIIKTVYITNIYDPEEPIIPQPGISMTKTALPASVKIGGKVTYTFVIRNTGDLPLFNVTFYDDKLDETIEIGDLKVGEEITITKEYTTNTTGTLVNEAEVKGYYDEGVYITDKDDASVDVYKDSDDGKDDDKQEKPKKPKKPEKLQESNVPEPLIEVPEEPIPEGAADPESPVGIIVQDEPVPTAPAKELPKTGGNPLALILSGITLAGVGLVIRRRS